MNTCPRCDQPAVMRQCRGCSGPVADCKCPRPLRVPEWRRRDLSRDETGRVLVAA